MVRVLIVVALAGLLVPVPTQGVAPAGPAPVDAELLDGTQPRSVIVSTGGPVTPELADRLAERAQLLETYEVINGAHMRATPEQVREIAALDAVTRVDEDEPIELHLGTSRPAVGVNDPVWEETSRGSNATVAVVDTGIDGNHPSLQGQVATEVTFTGGGGAQQTPTSTDGDGHGTHVANIVGGTGDRSKLLDSGNREYAGVAPAARLVSLDISQSFSTSTAIDAFDWVHENHEEFGIQVVQNSWGRKEVGQRFDPGDPAIRASNTLVRDDDLAVVFSAANKGPEPQSLAMEAMNPNVLSVAAVDTSGNVAEFSSRGPVVLQNGTEAPWVKPGVAAPGVRIKSATASGTDTTTYRQMSGTSQAAPHVAGLVGLITTRFPDLGALEVHEILRRSAQDIGPDGPDPATGYGYVDVQNALRLANEAGNGTLFATTETYDAQGTITGSSAADGILPDDTGVEAGRANGTIPVKASASELDLTVTWSPARAGLGTPDVEVTLVDPGGTELLVPADGPRAQRTIEDPAAGEWGWILEATGTGAADYTVNGSVEIQRDLSASIPADTGGGFPDGVPGEEITQLFEGAVDRFGLGPVAAGLGVGLVALIAITRAAAG